VARQTAIEKARERIRGLELAFASVATDLNVERDAHNGTRKMYSAAAQERENFRARVYGLETELRNLTRERDSLKSERDSLREQRALAEGKFQGAMAVVNSQSNAESEGG